jgi:DNA-binding response OmpR family regulator
MLMQVLLIEHSRPVARALQQGLEEQGITVVVAAQAEEAYAKAWTANCDVIILDLMLPKESGFALLQRLRQSGLNTPLLTLAAPQSTKDRVRSLDLGADDCLAKPFEFPELLARLSALVRRRARRKGPVIHVHDLEIDPATRTVKRAGHVIELTRREFTLLELLAQRPGEVVSRAMIWKHLYGEESANTSNVIDVYIRYLRRKIDKGFDTALILTQYGKGYLLRGEEKRGKAGD